MSLVITRQRSSLPTAATALERAVHLVPIEVVTVYAAVTGLAGDRIAHLALALLIAGALATPLVLAIHARHQRVTVPAAQHIVRVLSFVAWAFALANPLAPAVPIATWIPALSIVVVPALGSLLFPPADVR